MLVVSPMLSCTSVASPDFNQNFPLSLSFPLSLCESCNDMTSGKTTVPMSISYYTKFLVSMIMGHHHPFPFHFCSDQQIRSPYDHANACFSILSSIRLVPFFLTLFFSFPMHSDPYRTWSHRLVHGHTHSWHFHSWVFTSYKTLCFIFNFWLRHVPCNCLVLSIYSLTMFAITGWPRMTYLGGIHFPFYTVVNHCTVLEYGDYTICIGLRAS